MPEAQRVLNGRGYTGGFSDGGDIGEHPGIVATGGPELTLSRCVLVSCAASVSRGGDPEYPGRGTPVAGGRA